MPFNALKFLEDQFGSPEGVMNCVAKHVPSHVPQREAVAKWFYRQSVPSAWLPVLLVTVRQDTGEWPDLRRYMWGVGEHDIFS